jgi:lysophospholipase L1-like esterase
MVSLAAETIRLEISNAFGGSDLPITAASIAQPTNQTSGISGIRSDTAKPLTFSGWGSIVVPNGAVVLSDPIDFPVSAQSIVSVSLYLENGQMTNLITSHPGSRTTSYFAPGNQTAEGQLQDPASAEHWYFISAIEGVTEDKASAIAIVGDSITDGRGSTTNGNDRWPDQLLELLQEDPSTANIAIVNQAAGGNRILADGLGPNALGRIDRDVVAHPGVEYAIIFEGVNDIGTAPTDEASQSAVGERIIQAYDQIIVRLRRHGITVLAATITPMSGTGQEYGHPNREKTRQTVNEWIRSSGKFDAVIDFDEAVRDPDHPEQLLGDYDTGDHLHLNPAGYKAMADAVDLSLFGV